VCPQGGYIRSMNLGLLVLRLAVGGVFVWYGVERLGRTRPRLVGGPAYAGPVKQGWPTTLLVVLELGGGLLLMLGLLIFFASLLVSAAVMTGVLMSARREARADELTLLLLAAPFALTAVGPGEWSLDDALGFDWIGAGWALLQLGIGWVVAVAAAVAAGREEPGTVGDERARAA
jgi:putative oxidoreductase